ncbi:hypothetical protein [Mycolicibacter algericus]|nr:hypothetical protein [Mycolicibacter algericus]GFG87911.1 hypothetical protein MALGJ_45870 [Mycolicibacter algericus]
MRQHAKPGDITIDYDQLAAALTPTDRDTWTQPAHVRTVARAARTAAIDAAMRLTADHNVYLIHSQPSPADLDRYQRAGARIVTVDPGRAIVLARCKNERPWQMAQAAKQWYEQRAGSQSAPEAVSGSADATRSW